MNMRRARPLLGTIVEIQAGGNAAVSAKAISAAFAAVEKVHRLMSFHEPQSDVSRLNLQASRRTIKVHPWTWKVLKAAQRLSSASDGVFDITVAPTLAEWGYLPQSSPKDPAATWRDVLLEENYGVRFARDLSIDLGGIAKGFAVDRAVETMKRNRVRRGIVNAGGDVRVFGRNRHILQLRHPAHPSIAAGALEVRGCAIATSATYYSLRTLSGSLVSPLLDGRNRKAQVTATSVTVKAGTCIIADALTKVVLVAWQKAEPLLSACRAEAILVSPDGTVHTFTRHVV